MSCPWGWILGLDIHIHPQDHINTSVRFRENRHLGTRGTSERLSIYDHVASRVSSSSGSLSPALQLPAHCTLLTTELLLYLNTGTGTSIVVAWAFRFRTSIPYVCWFASWLLHFLLSSLLMCLGGWGGEWPKSLGPAPPGRSGRSSWPLAADQSSPRHCSHLGSESEEWHLFPLCATMPFKWN